MELRLDDHAFKGALIVRRDLMHLQRVYVRIDRDGEASIEVLINAADLINAIKAICPKLPD